MNLCEIISLLEAEIKSPHKGLPYDIFLFISRNTPLVNVDLLIKDEIDRTLLSWRDDEFHDAGWHIPGGIIRYKETMEERIQKVAKEEIGVTHIDYNKRPLAINEIIVQRENRAHFVSFLFQCKIHSDSLIINDLNIKENQPGFLKWHTFCPLNLIEAHLIYRKFI